MPPLIWVSRQATVIWGHPSGSRFCGDLAAERVQVGWGVSIHVAGLWGLQEEPRTHHFAVELVLAIQINTRWRIAPEKEMTPKQILALADLPWQEYSLYHPCDSVDPLPPDTPVKLHRGERFEAQRDGKYGDEVRNADRES